MEVLWDSDVEAELGAAVAAADTTLGMGSSAVTDMLDRLSVRVVTGEQAAE